MAFMDTLHQNVSWVAVLFAMIAISSGFIELRRNNKSSWLKRTSFSPTCRPNWPNSYRPNCTIRSSPVRDRRAHLCLGGDRSKKAAKAG
jgi:hypothetical protein